MSREKIPIHLRTAILSLGVIFLIEAGAKPLILAGLQNNMALLGGMRLLEAVSLILLAMVSETGLSSIGLRKGTIIHGIRRGIFWSVCFGSAAALVFALFQVMGIFLLERVRVPMRPHLYGIALFFLVGGLIGPLAEEIFFRGIVYGYFRRWGRLTAILSSTFFFVIAHPALPAIPVIQIAGGLLFAVLYEMEGSLLVPLSVHILGNMAIYTISLLFY